MTSQSRRAELQQAIVTNTAYHARLCAEISELEYAPAAKEKQSALIESIKANLVEGDKIVADLAKHTATERKEHKRLRDSKGRKLAHKILHREEGFEAKQKEKERVYVEALEAEMKERETCQELRTELDLAEKYNLELYETTKIYNTTMSQREELYRLVFDGFEEETPEQAPLREALEDAQYNFSNVQQLLDNERKATQYLSQAIQKLGECERDIIDARNNSGYEMWAVAQMAFQKVQDAIEHAQNAAGQATELVNCAIRLSPSVKAVGNIDIKQNTISAGFNLSTFITNIAFAEKLREAEDNIQKIKVKIKTESDAASSRATHIAQSMKQAGDKLEQSRAALNDARKAMFDKYDTLPGYDPK